VGQTSSLPCTDKTDLFFGHGKENAAMREPREAAAIALCRGCSHRAACLAGALARREQGGIWGGQRFPVVADDEDHRDAA
jgi:hypothetical protein